MLGDESRGWAFTRTLLGLPARTLHVCGDPAALPLLERVVAETGQSGGSVAGLGASAWQGLVVHSIWAAWQPD